MRCTEAVQCLKALKQHSEKCSSTVVLSAYLIHHLMLGMVLVTNTQEPFHSMLYLTHTMGKVHTALQNIDKFVKIVANIIIRLTVASTIGSSVCIATSFCEHYNP